MDNIFQTIDIDLLLLTLNIVCLSVCLSACMGLCHATTAALEKQ
jgi:hypothetical protein